MGRIEVASAPPATPCCQRHAWSLPCCAAAPGAPGAGSGNGGGAARGVCASLAAPRLLHCEEVFGDLFKRPAAPAQGAIGSSQANITREARKHQLKRAGRRAARLSSRRPRVPSFGGSRRVTGGSAVAAFHGTGGPPTEGSCRGRGRPSRRGQGSIPRKCLEGVRSPAVARATPRFGTGACWRRTPATVQREAFIVSIRPPGRWISSPPRPPRCRRRARPAPPHGAGDSCDR